MKGNELPAASEIARKLARYISDLGKITGLVGERKDGRKPEKNAKYFRSL